MPPYQWSGGDQRVHILPGGHWEPPGFLFIQCWPQRLGLGGSQFKITRFLRGVKGRLGRDKDFFWESQKTTHAAFTICAHKHKELNRVATAGLWRSCFLPVCYHVDKSKRDLGTLRICYMKDLPCTAQSSLIFARSLLGNNARKIASILNSVAQRNQARD